MDGEIVTSHCRVPYGTAADGAHSLLHAGRGSLCQHGKHTREEREMSRAKKNAVPPRD